MCWELGMKRTRYVDSSAQERINAVPTEKLGTRGLIAGEVHDENAFAGGGVFAHAGLFSPLEDVATFAKAIISINNGKTVAGIKPAVLRELLSSQAAPGTWRLGWDTPSPPPA